MNINVHNKPYNFLKNHLDILNMPVLLDPQTQKKITRSL